jgi:DinB superfamily
MQATELLREQVKQVHQYVEEIMATVTPEQAHWHPPGMVVNSLGGNYAHLLVVEDLVINAILKGGAPLFASSWAGKTGMSTLPPLPTPETPGLPSWQEWSTQVDIDLSALRSYAQATYAATEEYLASLSNEQLRQTVDLSGVGLGIPTVQWILSDVIVGHAYSHSGEIACLKGLQGIQGYIH